jgi:hypothetical protein
MVPTVPSAPHLASAICDRLVWSRTLPYLVLVGALVFGASAGILRAEKLVTVSAVADSSYVKRRAALPKDQKESVIFAKGQILGASTDADLTKTDFIKIAAILGLDFKSQRYTAAENFAKADLVIVAHWGMTRENDQPLDLLVYDPDAMRRKSEAASVARQTQETDLSSVSRALGVAAAAEADQRAETAMLGSLYSDIGFVGGSNADMLGFSAALAKGDDTAETLGSMIGEARYFMILVAYDGAALRQGKKQRAWTTRMSIRSAGVNFQIAVERMSSASARFHGTNQNDIVFEEAKDRPRS